MLNLSGMNLLGLQYTLPIYIWVVQHTTPFLSGHKQQILLGLHGRKKKGEEDLIWLLAS